MSVSKNIVWSPIDYDKTSVMARKAEEEMLARLEWMTLQPKVIVDMGAGLCNLSVQLQARYPEAKLIAIDSSTEMLSHAKQQHASLSVVRAKAEVLALPSQSVDLIAANFFLAWHADVNLLLREWKRVLRPDGLVILTTLGLDTLAEWQPHINVTDMPHLVDMHDVGDLLLQHGFADPVLDVDHYTLVYRDKEKLLAELKMSGMLAEHAALSSEPMPTTEGTWDVTYEIIFAHAFVPPATDEVSASEDGFVRIPLSHLRKQMPSANTKR